MEYKNRIKYKVHKNKYWDMCIEIDCYKNDLLVIIQDMIKKGYEILNIFYLMIWPIHWLTDHDYTCKFIKDIDSWDDTFRIKHIIWKE